AFVSSWSQRKDVPRHKRVPDIRLFQLRRGSTTETLSLPIGAAASTPRRSRRGSIGICEPSICKGALQRLLLGRVHLSQNSAQTARFCLNCASGTGDNSSDDDGNGEVRHEFSDFRRDGRSHPYCEQCLLDCCSL